MRPLSLVSFALLGAVARMSMAQTASGTLTVSATVAPSIQIYFVSDAGGPPLMNSGTNAAALSLGTVRAFGGTLASGVTRAPVLAGDSSFTVSAPFRLAVVSAVTATTGYTLTAQINEAETVGETWKIGSTALSTTPASIGGGVYGRENPYVLTLTIPLAVKSATISNSLTFVATAQ